MELKKIINSNQIKRRIIELAETINHDYLGEDVIFICVLKGSFIFFSDMIKQINLNTSIDFISISSYAGLSKSKSGIQLRQDVTLDVTNKHLIIVEDIIDTGNTLNYLTEHFIKKKIKSIF